MSTLYVAHTGSRHYPKRSALNDLDALKAFIYAEAHIEPRRQILLTSQGKNVRAQTLLTETEFFVFDSARLSKASPASSVSSIPDAGDFNPGSPPDAVGNQNDLQAWQNLFRLRRSWASGLLNGCESKVREAEGYQEQQVVIERSLGVAVASLQQHVSLAETKLAGVEAWSEEVLAEQHEHVGNWEANFNSLRDIPARPEFTRFIQLNAVSSRRASQQGSVASLQGFIDATTIETAAKAAQGLMATMAQKVNKMREDLDTATDRTNELLHAVEGITGKSWTSHTSEGNHLLDEIEMVVKKIGSDLEHVHSLPRSTQSVSQAQKMALLHTRNYLPNLSQYTTEMNELCQRYRQQRNDAAETAMEHMHTLSNIETILATLHPATKNFEAPVDEHGVFATLGIVSRLPSVYGALMIESVRRREWVSKMRRDAGTLQEELATYQDEEDKRRKKWIRSVEDLAQASALQSSVLGIELSLQNEGGSWPMITREDLQDYHKTLLDVYGPCAVTEEMDLAIKDLDKPTRKQIKHAKAFKNGSMHEAAFGDTSLMLRGDEQHRALREMNTRLDEELRGQKSRVRKLEDLLHRQTSIGRASTGDMFSPTTASALGRNVSSPVPPEDTSRNNSVQHNRRSSIQAIEEKKLAKRVVDLEAELNAAMEEASSRKNSDAVAQKQIEEATSTKKDLMENMEAQQREFSTERRGLEKDLAETKERVEELENEIERLMGSRDDERTGLDTRITDFEHEIARLKDDASGHAARAATESDARRAIERKLELADKARAEAESQLQSMRVEKESREEADLEQLQALATAHAHLSPDSAAPSGITALASALEDLTRRSATHAKDLEDAIAFAKSENQSLWSSNEKQKAELSDAAQTRTEVEDELRQLQDRLSTEEAKASSLQEQLNDEQEQVRTLRSKFAEGETGSEVLRQRAEEEEARAGRLSSELAEAKSHINSLDVEVMRLENKQKTYQASAEASSQWQQQRAERAKDVSQRLFAQNARLSRLLERLGLVVTYQDDTMVVERASKMGASTVMIDPHNSMNRTVSLTSPPPTRKASMNGDATDVSTIRWTDATSADDEAAQYEAFSQHIARFNIDTFGEAIVKRVRDFEYTARKYNKEAKEAGKRAEAYKERAAKTRTEASSKIAMKDFKEGDLALFLPTRGQAKGAWAAFNVGCPHFFLAERDGMRLGTRDFIVARISKIEQRVVDLSKALPPPSADGRSIDDVAEDGSVANDDNPFELSDGLTWWMVHATEERVPVGAPTTPGLGKSTVAAANVDARGSIRIKRGSKGDDASKHLNKSLDSRRSSSTSKKSVAGAVVPVLANAGGSPTVGTSGDVAASPGRPLPAVAGSGTGLGLGIAADANNVAVGQPAPLPQQNDQVRNDLLSRP